jgi:hypothetical protein
VAHGCVQNTSNGTTQDNVIVCVQILRSSGVNYRYYNKHRSGAVVEALRYKLEGRGIDSRWCYWNFSLK